MTYANLPLVLQDLLMLSYQTQYKTIIMVGWFILSLFYIFYWHKRQLPTPFLFVGTVRATGYIMAYLYVFLFWLIYPIYLNPVVNIDNLLIFVFSMYSIIIVTFWVLFVINFTLWIPKAIVNLGKLDITSWEDHAIKKYFGEFKKGAGRWIKK